MKKLLIFLLMLLIAAGFGVLFAHDPGYVLFAYDRWTIEMPLWLLVVSVIFVCLIWRGMTRLVRGIHRISNQFCTWCNSWFQSRSARNAARQAEIEKQYSHLSELAKTQSPKIVMTYWKNLPRRIRKAPSLSALYAYALMHTGRQVQAERFLRYQLYRQLDDAYLHAYAEVTGKDLGRQLRFIETYVAKHPNNPILLLTAGHLALRNQLWGKARAYFESSIALAPSAEAYAVLAQLLVQIGDTHSADRLYRAALQDWQSSK